MTPPIRRRFYMLAGRAVRLAVLAVGIFAFAIIAWAGEDKEQQLAREDVPVAVLAAFEEAYPKAAIKGFTKEEKDGKPFTKSKVWREKSIATFHTSRTAACL
jgi:hypothetical protein